jgi:hypothetical protein
VMNTRKNLAILKIWLNILKMMWNYEWMWNIYKVNFIKCLLLLPLRNKKILTLLFITDKWRKN